MPQTRPQHSDQIWSLSLGHHQSRQCSLVPTSEQNVDPTQVHADYMYYVLLLYYMYIPLIHSFLQSLGCFHRPESQEHQDDSL